MATSCPERSSSRESSTTCFCAPWNARSLMTNSTRIGRSLRVAVRGFGHPALAPQLERDEVPEALRVEAVVAGATLVEVAHRRGDHVGVEDARIADARRGQVLVHQGRELAAHPARERDREALLRPLDDLARHVLV